MEMQSTPVNSNGNSAEPSKIEKKDRPLKTIGQYAREVKGDLPKDILKPNVWRLGYYFSFYAVIVASVFAIKNFELAWYLKTLLGLVVGTCMGGAAFLAHEILHGSVVRNRKLQNLFGFIGFAPFMISPTFWRFWHNRLHHGFTQKIIKDPDAFPTLRIFKQSSYIQRMFKFTPGSGYLRSYTYFFFWFTFHNVMNQVYLRFRNRIFDDLNHSMSSVEFIGQAVIMISYAYWLGVGNLVYGAVLPFLVMNYLLMSYISTNHNVNPLTKDNDPLVNSLTVTNHPILEFLHLNFGYHIEHHLFPTMSPAHAKKVYKVLTTKYGDQYKQMSKGEAMSLLYKTPRVYKNANTLVHPYTGETHPTI